MRILTATVLLASLAAAQHPAAQHPAAAQQAEQVLCDRIKHEGLQNSKVMDYLDYLTNSIGQRLTGSDNFELACQWAKREFEKMGLDVHLEKWAEWKVRFNRGQWSGRVLKPVHMELQVATEAWTAGTKGQVTAEAIKLPKDTLDLELLADQVRGKWLVGTLPSRRARGAREYLRYLNRFCEEERVAGLVLASRGDAKFPNRIRVFGNRNMALAANSKTPTIPKIVVRRDQHQKIVKLLDKGKVVLRFDIRNRFRRERVPLWNVVADIVGREKPNEYVIVCGHLDSWHQATGATDNGTGVTSTMEAARILSAVGAKPRRTIRFILWGGEEQGLLGSRAYVAKHRGEMKRVSAVFNHDTGTNWAYQIAVPTNMYDDFARILKPVLSIPAPDKDFSGPVFKLRKIKQMSRRGGGSDHASFLAAGVPAWPWGLRGRSDYFQFTWHSQWDTFDAAIPEYQRHTSTVVALTAYGVAQLPYLLPRDQMAGPGSTGSRRRAAPAPKKTTTTKKN